MSIVFPVLRHLTVDGYELYQPQNSKGIDHVFTKGVHVIAGINGLGKTTLLNIIYRVLLGPKDMNKEDRGLASTQHKLVDWRNKAYFRARVSDGARNAYVTAEIAFGSRILTVRRSLATLEVQFLALDGVPEAEVTQEHYEKLAVELSGTASYFDFFAILRFLIFFLEDRPELIWDRRSQFDMFRLLFYDRQAARAAAEAYDEVQKLDSQYRNERGPIRKAADELAFYDAAEQSGAAAEIRGLRRAISAAQEKTAESGGAIEIAQSEYERKKLEREKYRLDLEEARRAFEAEQELFYQDVFPDLASTAEHVFLNLAAGNGCLVCGNKSASANDRLKKFAARHQCPVCESLPSQQENVVSRAVFSQKRLDRASEKMDGIRHKLRQLDQELEAADQALRNQIADQQESYNELLKLQRKLETLQRQVAPDLADVLATDDSETIALKRKYVEEGQARLSSLFALRTSAEEKYRTLKDGQQQRLSEKLGIVKASFARIAKYLLAEICLLRESKDSRKIGQEGETFDFPILEVTMTSAVFSGNTSPREDATSVSESQREFIDLAFRMALMETASEDHSPTMLVMETPEASLDSLFVTKAGDLFRGFAAHGGDLGNVFIASTNLNNENMIPALFGADSVPQQQPVSADDELLLGTELEEERSDAPPVPVEERNAHVINLLALSLPNAALRKHRGYYEEKLREAVYRDLDPAHRPSGPIGSHVAPATSGTGVEARRP
ncbi:AAA family ATPase [Phaeovibrio sulfidiphilus]|uniref:AAA family ATPase n=1 Tax=Phaeovibrio sulfidiphilus TaxID=1220600 RepID=A0A8J6YXC8_9PROT|nr:AAA family ATPase [Phaeovibrio sulfidiphilus]